MNSLACRLADHYKCTKYVYRVYFYNSLRIYLFIIKCKMQFYDEMNKKKNVNFFFCTNEKYYIEINCFMSG